MVEAGHPRLSVVRRTKTSGKGRFLLTDVAPGTYTLKPVKQGWRFRPEQLRVEVAGANILRQNFTGTPK